MFEGSFTNALDDKGRVAVPGRFRDALRAAGEEKLMITVFEVSGVPCLEAYVPRAWEGLREALESAGGAFGEIRVAFETLYLGSVQPCAPDKQGRIVLPAMLREHAEMVVGDELTFVGVGQKFRIFRKAGYQTVMATFRAMLRENPNLFHALGI